MLGFGKNKSKGEQTVPVGEQPGVRSMVEISAAVDPRLRSDKSEDFLEFYEKFLPSAEAVVNVLEVGVLTGGATLVLAQRLPKARILAVDINRPPSEFFDELDRLGAADRVTVAIGSQSDPDFLLGAIQDCFGGGQLDVVIDDASHVYAHTKATFNLVFVPKVRVGGMYAIEDWGCGYWPTWPDGNSDGHHGLPLLIKELIDLVALEDRTREWDGHRALPVARQFRSPIESTSITNGIAVFIRSRFDGIESPEDSA